MSFVSPEKPARLFSSPDGAFGRVLAPVPLPEIAFSQAFERSDIHGAYALLYNCYLERGLIRPNRAGLRYTHYNLLPESATFVAKAGEEVIATLSAIIETRAFGVPMSEVYADELEGLRTQGFRFAEGSGLAVDPAYRPIGMHLVMNLVKMAITYARKLGASYATIACHPRHARFYRQVFLFQEFGERRTYGAVNDAPAVALGLDLEDLEQTYRRATSGEGDGIYRFFFTDEIFRCPNTALRSAALGKPVVQELLALQPFLIEALETRAPGTVAALTGWEDPDVADRRGSAVASPLWEEIPAFVAA
ncbi:MAG: GNAT family N-acetyltransferase [Thermodesulfobacteriota bacterium]